MGHEDGHPAGSGTPGGAGRGDRGGLSRGERAVGGLPGGAAGIRREAEAGVEGALTPRRAARPAACLLIAVLAVAGCRHEAEQRAASSPYVVQVDLASQIHAFGEDTATADE